MTVLILTSRMDVGGAETHIDTLCRSLRTRGDTVILCSSGGRTANALQDSGVSVVTLPLDKKDPVSLLKSYRGLRKLLRTKKPDVMHSHMRIPSFLCGRLQKKKEFSHIPLVTTVHTPYQPLPFFPFLDVFGDRTVAVSDDIKEHLLSRFRLPFDRIVTVGNGIDTRRFSPLPREDRREARKALKLPADGRVLLCASRSDESRGALLLYLSEHAAEYLKEDETLVLLCASALPKEKDLLPEICRAAKKANEMLARDAVTVLPEVSDISAYLRASDIFFGVSRAALEAMSCGLPVILAGNEGFAGLFTPENAERLWHRNLTCRGCETDFSRLKQELERLSCAATAERLGEYGRQFVCGFADGDAMTEAVRRVYEDALRKKQKSRLPTAVVCGYYGAFNMGDDAIAQGIGKIYGEKASLCFIARHPHMFRHRTGENAVGRLPLLRLWRTLKRSSLFIFGGGNLLQDRTSFRSLAYYTLVCRMAKKAGCRIILEANGIGPLLRPRSASLCRQVLLLSDEASFRERESLSHASRLCPQRSFALRGDPALLTEPAPDGYTDYLCEKLGLTAGGFFAVFPSSDLTEEMTEQVCAFCRQKEEEGLLPLVLPLHLTLDAGICVRLAKRLDGAVTLPRLLCPEELCGILKRAAFVLSARLHGGIFAHLSKTPFLLLDTQDGGGKCAAFCRTVSGGKVLLPQECRRLGEICKEWMKEYGISTTNFSEGNHGKDLYDTRA